MIEWRAEQECEVCECGDYRRDHKDWIGKCCFGKDLTHGYEECVKFKLDKSATATEKARRGPNLIGSQSQNESPARSTKE